MAASRADAGCTCVVGDAVEYHGHRRHCPANAATGCDTCGKYTGMDTGICGQCAEDWNDRDQAAGLARINGRRKAAGLEPITREGSTA